MKVGVPRFSRSAQDRYEFLCDSFFWFADPTDTGWAFVQEIVHFGGRNEDLTPLAGVRNPPTTNQISDAVEAASTAPQEVGDD